LLERVAGQLDKKRLLIVSDGALEYIPFAALPSPQGRAKATERGSGSRHSSQDSQDPRPLIVDHEIVSLPSASVLAVLRRELTDRQPAPKALAVLADPVFSNDDPRMALNRATGGTTPVPSPADVANRSAVGPEVTRSAREAGLNDFVRLRFSRQEAEAITSLLQEKDRLKALDFTASRATARSQELGQYRIIHFATHGLLNSRHPELSGLVFSLINEEGKPQDGFLRSYDIYNLKLNADLVVLSACQTALGKEVRGEGLIGLTRGFMYAGVPRVVASLWRVDDRATAELMKRFYQGMLRAGQRPAAALRAAQVSMLKEKRWSAPHYWAAFTIQGEWR
jgi:CHAT domain-containing protein